MSNIKYTCPTMWPSGCVLFTGDLPGFIPANTFTCDGNLDELLEKYGAKIDEIDASIDLTAINKGCFAFNPATGLIKDFVQESIDKTCSLESSVSTLQDTVDNLNIGSLHINIDLESLTPVGDPCAVAPNTYTLISVLNLFKSEIISLKAQI
jgi:hypothetical protein